MNQDEVIIRIPENWGDINIGQFQELMNLVEDTSIDNPTKKMVKQISILADIDEVIIYDLPATSIKTLNEELSTFQVQPTQLFKNIIEVEGVKYGFQKDMNLLTLGEWIDLESFVTNSPIDNLHNITALLYRPIIEQGDEFFSYKIKAYKDINLQDTASLFRAKVSVQDIYGIVVFFLSIVQTLLKDMTSSSPSTTKQIQKATNQLKRIIEKEIRLKKKQTLSKKKKVSKNGSGNILSTT